MSYEGAMLGGYLLPEKEFIEIMTLFLDQKQEIIFNQIDSVLKYIQQRDIKRAYFEWNTFQTQILKNPTTSLLAIVNFYNKTAPQTWTFVDNEEHALINKSGTLGVLEIEEGLKREYISSVLTKHLSNLFKEVLSRMEVDEINYLYSLNKSEIYESLNPIKYGNKAYTYQKAIYGKLKGQFYRGKVADAYVNHLGAKHQGLFSASNGKDFINISDSIKEKSVKKEERAINSLNFVKLLLASTNRTAWYTGGDLIITDKTGRVIANVQVKTSATLGDALGVIRTSELEKQIKIFKETMKIGTKDTAKKFYNALKTSSVGEFLGDAVLENILTEVKNNLELI